MRLRASARVGASLVLLVAPGTALALTTPMGSAADARVTTAAYSPANIIALHAAVGRALLVQLPKGEVVTDVTLSDTADILPPVIVANSVTFKAKAPMAAMPLFIYARPDDGAGQPRIYKFELDAKIVAGDDQPFSVTVTDPAAVAAAKAAAWRRAEAARKAADVRSRLDAPLGPPINTDYTARGNAALLGR